jgi:predicted RNA-binding protein associated with RNAse of E/G family
LNLHWFRSAGEHATLRGIGRQVYWTYPTIIVQDTSDLVVLYQPAGVLGKNTDHRPTPKEVISSEKINVVDHQWTRTDLLMLIVPEESFSTYIMWETGTKNIDCWYINLQEPIRRTSIGFDTTDNWLDVVISPDMNEWHWKDEDEFTAAQNVGLYSAEKAREIWAEGEKAVQLVTKERRALYEQWKEWQPNPEWEFPKLSPLWETIR